VHGVPRHHNTAQRIMAGSVVVLEWHDCRRHQSLITVGLISGLAMVIGAPREALLSPAVLREWHYEQVNG
jgi:hypothetical protein